jgi:Flp pilus assembly protein TadG
MSRAPIKAPLRLFARARSGLAAVEFALILPVMLTLFFGTSELTTALSCRADVTSLASTAADLVAQESKIETNDMAIVFSALNEILYPYPTANAQIVISSLVDDGQGDGKAKVVWSDAQNATARNPGDLLPVPAGLIATGSSVILAEVKYNYAPSGLMGFVGNIAMTNSFYARPRLVAQISRVTS